MEIIKINKHLNTNHKITVGDIAAGAGMIGSLFVGLGDAYTANLLWAAANPVMILHHWRAGDYNYMIMFIFYELCAVFGVVRHLWGAV